MAAKEVVDAVTMKRALTRITYEIIERNKDLNKLSEYAKQFKVEKTLKRYLEVLL